MRTATRVLSTALLAGLLAASGCAGRMRITKFINPDFDFSFLERVAVLPFENLSDDRDAGSRSTRIMITELLATGSIDVVEPGEVSATLAKLPGAAQTGQVRAPGNDEVIALGKQLGVQAVIMGGVAQSETIRSGAVSIPVVTLDAHMVETETGSTVWAATHTEKGGGFGARVVGSGAEPISKTTRRCVRRMIATLVK